MPMAWPWFAFRNSTELFQCRNPDPQTPSCVWVRWSRVGFAYREQTPQAMKRSLIWILNSRCILATLGVASEMPQKTLTCSYSIFRPWLRSSQSETTLTLVLLIWWIESSFSSNTSRAGNGGAVGAGTWENEKMWRKITRIQSKRNIYDAFSKQLLNLVFKHTEMPSGLVKWLKTTALRAVLL